MLHFAIELARHRISALLAVAAAVLGGAALVTGTGVLAESGLRSHLPPGRLGGADLVISANQIVRPAQDLPLALPERRPVPAGLVDRLARIPGVTAAVGDLSFPAAPIDVHNRLVPIANPGTAGHGWSSTRLLPGYHLDGTAPAGPGEVAVDAATARAAGVRPGDQLRVVAAGHSSRYRVSAVVGTSGASTSGAGIFFADPQARQLAGREAGLRSGTVDLVGLRVAPGTAASVRAAVTASVRRWPAGGGLTVATGRARGDSAAPELVAARSLLVVLAGSLAGIILLIIGFVVAGALAVSISGQRRELALLRAVGATGRQVRRLVATQATVIAAVALGPGVGLGYLLAGQFRRLLVGLGMLPPGLPLTFSPLPAVAAVILLTIVVQVSARGAAWRTSRRPATEAVAESQSEARPPSALRTRAGLLLMVVAVIISIVPLLARSQIGAAFTSMAGIVAAIGLALTGPALIRRVSDALARGLPSAVSPPTWLAVANTQGYALRVAGAVSALAMAVLFVLTYTLAQTTVTTATARDLHTATLAQYRITAAGLGGLPDGLVTQVRGTTGVRAAATVTGTTVLWTYQQFGDPEIESDSALILTPAAPAVLDLDVRTGDLSRLTGDTIAVGSDVARSRHAGIGQQVNLTLGDGTRVRARVVATYGRSLGFGPIVLSHDLAAGHTTAGLDQSLLVRTAGTAPAARALAALVAAHPGLSLNAAQDGSGAQAGTGTRGGTPPEVWINLATIAVLLGYLLLSIANKLVAATAQRGHEIAALRLIGATPAQIRAMMRREAGLICAAALTAGLILAAVPLVLLGIGFLHRPWPAGPFWLLPGIALTVTTIAFSSVEIPTRRALRTPPAQALARP